MDTRTRHKDCTVRIRPECRDVFRGSASLCTGMRCGAVGWHERGQAGSHLHMADNVNGGLLLTVSLAPECQRRANKRVGLC